MKQWIKALGSARRLRDERGAAMIELALCMSMLLLLAFGVIDFSQIIYDRQMLSGLTRQGSSLASRTLTLPETVSALGVQGAPMNIGTKGRIIVTAVKNDTSGKPYIFDQAESAPGISVTSQVGSLISGPATMPAGASTVLNAGQIIYVTEVFYSYSPMTPLGGFFKTTLPSTLYESAYF